MTEQLTLFAGEAPSPEGLRYTPDFISPEVEEELIAHVAALPLQPFQFGQYEGKRRVASFGFRYDYSLRRLEEASSIPAWLKIHRRKGRSIRRSLNAHPAGSLH